jgi:transcriptional regulator with XRE-family HTH domain
MGITLRDLAGRSGLTPGFISLVERDQAEPSITSMRKIALALHVPLFHLFAEDGMDSPVVHPNQRRRLRLPGARIEYEVLSPSSARQLLFYTATLEPNTSSSDELATHPMEECTLVLRGKLRLEVGPDTYFLEAGDSICWDGNLPHRLSAVGDVPLEVISCATPPVF